MVNILGFVHQKAFAELSYSSIIIAIDNTETIRCAVFP